MFNIDPVIVKFTLDESILGQKRYRQKKNVEITSTSSVTDRLSSRQDKWLAGEFCEDLFSDALK